MPQPLPRGRNPFDDSGVERDADGRARYTGLPDSLVAMLRASVERDAEAPAVLEVGGPSITFGELWERSARVAGGLAARSVARGDRVAIRLGNGIDWVLAFFGAQLLGAVVVPVNTRFTEDEVAYVVTTPKRATRSPTASRCPTASRSSPRSSARTISPRSSTRAARPASRRAR